jgi:hypothetical protein
VHHTGGHARAYSAQHVSNQGVVALAMPEATLGPQASYLRIAPACVAARLAHILELRTQHLCLIIKHRWSVHGAAPMVRSTAVADSTLVVYDRSTYTVNKVGLA